jgi:hypothetical protein
MTFGLHEKIFTGATFLLWYPARLLNMAAFTSGIVPAVAFIGQG